MIRSRNCFHLQGDRTNAPNFCLIAASGGKGGEHLYDNVLTTVAYLTFDEETGEYLGADYGYDCYAGTSMAASQVAAAVALVKSAHPRYTSNQVRNALIQTAEIPEEYERKYYWAGGESLDTLGAVQE